MMHSSRVLLLLLVCVCFPAGSADSPLPTTAAEIDSLARHVAGAGDSVTRTQRLVSWMSSRLEWVATDYESRTPEQILARGAGNCADLSSVLERLLRPAAIPYRWVAEINLQPASDEREANARAKVKENGPRMSVFGRRYNDHRWLEVLDERSQEWVPADPATGLVGTQPWLLARVAFEDRPPAPVPAAADDLAEMIVPLTIFVAKDKAGVRIDRSQHYLIDELDRLYGGKAHTLSSWSAWVAAVQRFAPIARGAFDNRVDLHQQPALIDDFASAYDALKKEAHAAGLRHSLTTARNSNPPTMTNATAVTAPGK
jgi:Transglutaminase-like superfamily